MLVVVGVEMLRQEHADVKDGPTNCVKHVGVPIGGGVQLFTVVQGLGEGPPGGGGPPRLTFGDAAFGITVAPKAHVDVVEMACTG